MDRRTFMLSLMTLFGGVACSSVPPLANTHPSPESLATAVLGALARKDRRALEALALGEQEFRDYVWPELPAARPERNLPFSYVWGDLHQKSQSALGATLQAHGGRRYDLVAVRFEGASTHYTASVVHRRTVLTVLTQEGGQEDLRLFGSSIEQNGGWKVFSYVAD